jgi:hypothetical protein
VTKEQENSTFRRPPAERAENWSENRNNVAISRPIALYCGTTSSTFTLRDAPLLENPVIVLQTTFNHLLLLYIQQIYPQSFRVCGHLGFPTALISDSSFQKGVCDGRKAICFE